MRKKKIAINNIFPIDTLSIIPNSFSILNLDSSYYNLDCISAKLHWLKKPLTDSVLVSYRVFPFKLNSNKSHYTYDSIADRNGVVAPIYANEENAAPLFNFGKIDYNGSFGRSMSFGNSQSAVFNSDFNLQMNGYIGDSIHLRAAISDNNIPIQPQGTTQQLNSFDNILLQFSKNNWEVNLGDIDLKTTDNYFLNFSKRIEGIGYQQKVNILKNITNTTYVSGAIQKGNFARNVLSVSDGNQGPYHLVGNNNELYFIVLAGTEKVFLNGQLLQRGASQDYTIDYNAAEITFMPRHMITKDSRVQVEFQYAVQNYLNTQEFVNNETNFGKKFKLNVSFYNDADSKNSPINQSLDSGQINFLKGIGDSIQNAYYPIAVKDTFSANAIMYKKIDTVVNNQHDSIFVYSVNPDSALYNLSFVGVGVNKGNYIPLMNGTNGQAYQWVAPVNGVPQGSYEPAQFLITPKKQQMLTVKGTYLPDSNTIIQTQVARSIYNVNTFAPSNSNDVGYAGKAEITNVHKWKTENKKQYSLISNGSFEFESQHFQPIEPLRPVEFARDWGLQIIPSQASEKLGMLNLTLKDEQNNFLNYQFATYLRGDGYRGFKNILGSKLFTKNGWHFDENVSYTNISMPSDKGYYFTPTIDISKTFSGLKNYTIGASYSSEINNVKNLSNDSVLATSYAFDILSAYIKSDQSKKNNWSLIYTQRTDKAPNGNAFTQTDHSRNLSLLVQLLESRYQQLKLTATYRQLFVDDSSLLSGQLPDKSFLGRIEYMARDKKGFFVGNLLYDVGSGQEQQMAYSFYQVPAGQGQYTWIDYNHDGVPELNEFVLAAYPDEATYIKIFTPTNVYIKANYTTFNYSFSLTPKMLYGDKKNLTNIQNILSKLSFQSSLQSNKKQVANGSPEFNPFNHHIADTALLNWTYIFSNTLSINRMESKWGLDFSRLINYNKALLTYGSQATQTNTWSVKGRYNFAKAYTLQMEQRFGSNNMNVPAFTNENYALNYWNSIPSVTYTNSTKWRLTVGYNYQSENNSVLYGGEKMTSNALNLDAKYNAVQNTSVSAQFSLSNISYNGDPTSTVSYTILQGLQPGKNYVWTINFTKRLLNNIEINFQYQGRKPGDTKLINIGTASVRAIL